MKLKSTLLLSASLSLISAPSSFSMDRLVDFQNNQGIHQDLKSLTLLLQKANDQLPTQLHEGIFFFGQTGSGKSTLINALLGVPLVVEKDLPKTKISVSPNHQGPFAPIGDKSISQTTIPQIYGSFCDCPGYKDTKGTVQNIVNSYSIYQLCQLLRENGHSKIVLVVSEKDLGDRRSGLLETLFQMSNSFEEIGTLLEGTSLVVTKNQDWDHDNIQELFQKILEEGQQGGLSLFTQGVQQILEFFVNHPQRIAFFDTPDNQQIGQALNPQDFAQISNTLTQTNWIHNIAPKILLTDAAKLLLRDLFDDLTLKTNEWLSGNFSDSSYRHVHTLISSHQGSVADLRNKIKDFQETLRLEKKQFKDDLRTLKTLSGRLADPQVLQEAIHFLNQINFIQNIDPLAGQDKPYRLDGWDPLLQDLEALRSVPVFQYENNILTLQGLVFGAFDVNKALNGRKPEEIRLYAGNTFLMDENIVQKGVHFSLLAPTWKIIGHKVIDLSREKGQDPSAPARQGQSADPLDDDVDKKIHGAHGSPGKPGQNGGNFYGFGKKFEGIANLTINASGGQGGDGQRGGKGADGKDYSAFKGRNDRILDDDVALPHDKREFLKERKKFECESFGDYIVKGVKFLGTFNTKFVETYEVQFQGQQGGHGGRGGIGGLGGYFGEIKFENDLLVQKPEFLKRLGQRGQHGQPGNPGRGGKGGFYRGVYENEYVGPAFRGVQEFNIEAQIVVPVSVSYPVGAYIADPLMEYGKDIIIKVIKVGHGVLKTIKELIAEKGEDGVQELLKNGLTSTTSAFVEHTAQQLPPKAAQEALKQGSAQIIEESAKQGSKEIVKEVSKEAGVEVLENTTLEIFKASLQNTGNQASTLLFQEGFKTGGQNIMESYLKMSLMSTGEFGKQSLYSGVNTFGGQLALQTTGQFGTQGLYSVGSSFGKEILFQGGQMSSEEILKQIGIQGTQQGSQELFKQVGLQTTQQGVFSGSSAVMSEMYMNSMTELLKRTTQEVSQGAGKEVTKQVLTTGLKEGSSTVLKEGAQQVLTTGTEQVAKAGSQVAGQMVKEAGKEAVSTTASTGTSFFTKVGSGVKTVFKNPKQLLTGMAKGLGVQAGISILSQKISSGWKENPVFKELDTKAPDGQRIEGLNTENLQKPLEPQDMDPSVYKNQYDEKILSQKQKPGYRGFLISLK